MKKIILSVLTTSALISCEKTNPNCLDQKIQDFSELCNSFCETVRTGSSVKQYTFEGETVYVFSTGTCSGKTSRCVGAPSKVFDSDCNEIGSFGGFSSMDGDDIDGSEFTNENFIRTVWEN